MTLPERTIYAIKHNFPALLLCAAALAVFFPALLNGFVDWDDSQYVVLNHALRGGWREVFTFFPGYYHPLTILTYKAEFSLFGLTPLPYHFTNLALHAACGVSVFYFFAALGARPWSAFLGALLFIVHPVHVEPVAWISGRKELLWALFSFWSLTSYLKFLDGRGRKFIGWSLLFFLLAALSKPAALVLPFVILLLDYYRGRSFSTRLLAEKLPYLALALLLFALSSSPSGFLLGGGGAFSFAGAAAADIQSAFFYLGKLAVPASLSALYPPVRLFFRPAWYLLAALFAAALPAWAALTDVRARENFSGAGALRPGWRKKLFFAMLFSLVTAFPGLIISPPADRYAYVPAAGLFFLYGELVFWLYGRARSRMPTRGAGARFSSAALVLLVTAHFLMLALASFQRTAVWKDSLTLWNDVAAKDTLDPTAYYGRGNAYAERGLYAPALADLNRCLELDPSRWRALSNRGRIFTEMKNTDRAVVDYNAAIALNPSSPQLFLNRGNAYFIGRNYSLAVKDYDWALELAPGFSQAAENRHTAQAASRQQNK